MRWIVALPVLTLGLVPGCAVLQPARHQVVRRAPVAKPARVEAGVEAGVEAAPAPKYEKAAARPAANAGSVPMEGFRPMRGQPAL